MLGPINLFILKLKQTFTLEVFGFFCVTKTKPQRLGHHYLKEITQEKMKGNTEAPKALHIPTKDKKKKNLSKTHSLM